MKRIFLTITACLLATSALAQSAEPILRSTDHTDKKTCSVWRWNVPGNGDDSWSRTCFEPNGRYPYYIDHEPFGSEAMYQAWLKENGLPDRRPAWRKKNYR